MRRFLREFDFIKGVKTGALALALLAASLLAVQPAESADRYFLSVVNEQGDTGVGAVGRCRVLTTGTTTDATVYTTSTLATSVTNPVALGSDGECSWWGATSTTYDVIVVIDSGTYKGSRVHVAGVTAQTARKVLVTRSSAEKVLMIPYSGTTAATVTDTRTFPAGAVATRVIVESQVGGTGTAAMHIGHQEISVAGFCSAVVVQSDDTYYYCAPTAPTAGNANGRIHATTAYAVQYTTQGHTASGYIWLYYIPSTF